jgi:hypothetical protein
LSIEHATAPVRSGAVAAGGTMIGAGDIIVTDATLLSFPSVPFNVDFSTWVGGASFRPYSSLRRSRTA